jgi:hypothetical protein
MQEEKNVEADFYTIFKINSLHCHNIYRVIRCKWAT